MVQTVSEEVWHGWAAVCTGPAAGPQDLFSGPVRCRTKVPNAPPCLDKPVLGQRGGGHANYWAPLTRKRHTPPHPAQPQHANYWAPRTRKRHQQEHPPQRPTERSDPTQHAKGRTGDRPGPRKGATTRRNVTRGVTVMEHNGKELISSGRREGGGGSHGDAEQR